MEKPLTLGYFNRVSNNRDQAFIWQSLHFTGKYGREQMLWSCAHLQSHSVPIENYSFSYNTCLSNCIFLQTFDDGASVLTHCTVQRLQSILNPDEAKNNRLIINTYKNAVRYFCNEGKSDDKIMLVAFEKASNDPSGLILLKKRTYEASKLTSLPGHAVPSDMRTTTRKLMWEVSYCVRRIEKRSSCLGDILLSCAIEEVAKRAVHDSHGASTYIWLVLAGGFANVPALRLYLAHGFEVIGFYEVESEVFMAVRNVGEESTRRTLKQVKGKLESTFLLPVLKDATARQPPMVPMESSEDVQDHHSTEAPRVIWMVPSHEDIQDSQSIEASGMNLFSQESSVAARKSTEEGEFQGTHNSSELDIEMESPQKIQEDQFPLSGVSDEAAISEQSTAATDNPVEPEDEGTEVSI